MTSFSESQLIGATMVASDVGRRVSNVSFGASKEPAEMNFVIVGDTCTGKVNQSLVVA